MLFTTKNGGTWGVFGSHFWDLNITTGQRQLLLNTANYLAKGLPAYLKTPAQVLVIPRVNHEGKIVAVLVSG
ncbi:MAG: hypothetical protein RSC76_03520 [Oscillospiraceae bacterium]